MQIYNLLFDIPDPLLWFCCVAFFLGLSCLLAGGIGLQRRRHALARNSQLSHTLISGLLVPIGLNMVFLANDVWKENEKGQAAVEQEAEAVADSLRILRLLPDNIRDPLHPLLTTYIDEVIGREWPKMANGKPSGEVESLLDRLSVQAASAGSGMDAQNARVPAQLALLNSYVQQVRNARDVRLLVSGYHISLLKWLSLLLLMSICMYVIFDVHYHIRNELTKAIILISLSFGTISFLILVNDRPFTGSSIIEPDRLRQIQKSLHPSPDAG